MQFNQIHLLLSNILIGILAFSSSLNAQVISNPTRLLCHEIVQVPANFAQIQELIKVGADINCHCETIKRTRFLRQDKTIIHFYAPHISEYHVKANSSKNTLIERVYVSPMQIALAREDYALMRFLIGSGVNLNHHSSDGLKPLEYALHTRKQSLANFLMNMGADMKKVNIGCPRDVNMARFYVNRGADPRTIRIDCALSNKKLAQQLINLNPDFKGKNLSDYSFNDLIQKPKLLEFLLVNSFSPDGMNNSIEQRTLLSLAAELGKSDIVDILLKHDANINLRDAEELTPLCHAVMNNETEIVKKLIQNGAKINTLIGDKNVQTPLSMALKQRNSQLVGVLLENGANIRLGDDDLLAKAIEYNDENLIRQLIQYGESPQRLMKLYTSEYLFDHPKTFEFVISMGALQSMDNSDYTIQAVKTGNNDIAELLIKHKTGLSKADSNGKTPLHYAFEQKNYALAYQLIEAGANVNAQMQGFEPFLHRAVNDKNLVMLHKLIQNGADLNSPNSNNITALHVAVLTRNYEMAKILLKANAIINCEDLFKAIHLEHYSMVKILVENGADLNCKKRGKTIVQYAKKNNLSYRISQYLKGAI